MSVWPSGCECHAVRAPRSNLTIAPVTLEDVFFSYTGHALRDA